VRVLLVEDDDGIAAPLVEGLAREGFDVEVVGTGQAALAAPPASVVILDLGLPDMDGAEVIAGLRGWTKVPILVLSGRADATDKVDALDAGADDYVTKPFSVEELMARLRALQRRVEADAADEPVVAIGHFNVDLAARAVTRRPDAPASAPEAVHLTKTEWAVLEVLVRNPGRLVSGKQLLQQVWGPAYKSETNYLRFYMAKLRQKLEPEPSHPRQLLTEPGMGYRFQP
jgi:two-component system KDP operon response regulator KdpE